MAKTKKKEPRKIPGRNYVFAVIIVVAAIITTIYVSQLYNLYQDEKIKESYLISEKIITYEIKELPEMESVMLEAPNEYYLFISYNNDQETYELEKNLKNVIKKYDLEEKFYYLNVTDIKDEDNYLDQINASLKLDDKVKSIPTILYYRDGKLVDDGVITREDDAMMNAGDFEYMLDILGIIN